MLLLFVRPQMATVSRSSLEMPLTIRTDTITITINQHSGRVLFPWTRAGSRVWYDLWYMYPLKSPGMQGSGKRTDQRLVTRRFLAIRKLKGGGVGYARLKKIQILYAKALGTLIKMMILMQNNSGYGAGVKLPPHAGTYPRRPRTSSRAPPYAHVQIFFYS